MVLDASDDHDDRCARSASGGSVAPTNGPPPGTPSIPASWTWVNTEEDLDERRKRLERRNLRLEGIVETGRLRMAELLRVRDEGGACGRAGSSKRPPTTGTARSVPAPWSRPATADEQPRLRSRGDRERPEGGVRLRVRRGRRGSARPIRGRSPRTTSSSRTLSSTSPSSRSPFATAPPPATRTGTSRSSARPGRQ